jgi:hypothetical protein
MEYWSIDVAEQTRRGTYKTTPLSFGFFGVIPNTPALHFSNTPFLSLSGR